MFYVENLLSVDALSSRTVTFGNVADISIDSEGTLSFRALNDDPIIFFSNIEFNHLLVEVVMKIIPENISSFPHAKLYYTSVDTNGFDEDHCISEQILRFGSDEVFRFNCLDFQKKKITGIRFDPCDFPGRVLIKSFRIVPQESRSYHHTRLGDESVPDRAIYELSASRNAHQRKHGMVTCGFGKPNFFILGAGKCGTTTLYGMLRQHPEIFMPSVKEPTFYCSHYQVISDPVTYHGLFADTDAFACRGEASHAYFSNPETPALLHLLYPDAKFILILRNPSNRAYSMFQDLRKMGVETISDFVDALNAEESRFNDRDFFSICPQYFWNFMYKRSSRYDIQLARYLELYPLSQFFVMSLSELRNDPITWAKSIFSFLGVSKKFTPYVGVLNKGVYSDHISPKTRSSLDDYFSSTFQYIQDIVGRDMNLSSL